MTSVTINQQAAGVDLTAGGGTLTLTVKIEPANATNQTLTWTSIWVNKGKNAST